MKVWAEKNNKVSLAHHFYTASVEGKTFSLVRLEAESWGRMGNTNKWDAFFSATDVFYSQEKEWLIPEDATEREMTRWGGTSGYFGVRIKVLTPLGEEEETHFPRWKGVPFRELNNEQFKLVIEASKDAQSSGFGSHGRFLHLDEFLQVEEMIDISQLKYKKYSWGLEIEPGNKYPPAIIRFGKYYFPHEAEAIFSASSPEEVFSSHILERFEIKINYFEEHNSSFYALHFVVNKSIE